MYIISLFQSSKGFMPEVEIHETDGNESLPEIVRLIPREADFLMAYSMIPGVSHSFVFQLSSFNCTWLVLL